MEMSANAWNQAQATARGFLCRWSDRFTRRHLDDLVQDTLMESYRSIPHLRDGSKVDAFVRTIARRRRAQSLDAERRRKAAYDRYEPAASISDSESDELWTVAGATVSKDWLLSQLKSLLDGLAPLSRALVRGYYEGMSCAELASRYSIPAGSVRKRIHRTRVQLRMLFQMRVRNTHGERWSQDAHH